MTAQHYLIFDTAGGFCGGFSAPGGSAAKRRMLELEGIHLEPPPLFMPVSPPWSRGERRRTRL
jgi:hypothetical protein